MIGTVAPTVANAGGRVTTSLTHVWISSLTRLVAAFTVFVVEGTIVVKLEDVKAVDVTVTGLTVM